jgi:hypothetical protein
LSPSRAGLCAYGLWRVLKTRTKKTPGTRGVFLAFPGGYGIIFGLFELLGGCSNKAIPRTFPTRACIPSCCPAKRKRRPSPPVWVQSVAPGCRVGWLGCRACCVRRCALRLPSLPDGTSNWRNVTHGYPFVIVDSYIRHLRRKFVHPFSYIVSAVGGLCATAAPALEFWDPLRSSETGNFAGLRLSF